MQEDVRPRATAQVSIYNHADNCPEIALHGSASGDLSLDQKQDGCHTIFLPIQSHHLYPLFPERRRVKVVTRNPRKTRIHSHQVSQIMFLDTVICVSVLQQFLDLWFRETVDMIIQCGLGQLEVTPLVCFGVDCHVGENS
jgi:hypothetical protein